MIDIIARNIRWHNPNSKNPKLRQPDHSRAEAYFRLPDFVMHLSEEERRKHVMEGILGYFKIEINQEPYDFEYEILDDPIKSPQVSLNPERWKESLQRRKKPKKPIELPEWPPKKPSWFKTKAELAEERRKLARKRREEE
jgi:hypothetical protein